MVLHVLALVMEIEPGIFDCGIVVRPDHFRETVSDALLRSLFVDEVDHVILLVGLLDFCHVILEGTLVLDGIGLYH